MTKKEKAEQEKLQEQAREAFERGVSAQKKKDFDTAVWEFFRACRLAFGEKKYHEAFANALLKRGLKPLEEKDAAKAEELYQKANNTRELVRLDLRLEAALLGHLDAAYKLRKEFVISVWTAPESKALDKLLLEADYPPILHDAGINCYYGMGGYPYNKQKAFEYLEKAASLGYEEAAKSIQNYKQSEQEEIEAALAAKEFARQNPPLKGREKKAAEDVLTQFLHSSLARKATLIVCEERKPPPPEKQIYISHVGGYPYFEKGAEWPCYTDGNSKQKIPYDFMFQVFQDDANSIVLPDGIKLVQLFCDLEERKEHLVLYRKLHTENAVLIKNPLPRSLKIKYQSIKFENVNMLPDYYDAVDLVPETEALSEKVHPGRGEYVYERLCKNLGFTQPLLESYLGGYMGQMDNSPRGQITDKNILNLFQIYLASDGEGPFGWGRWDDAMVYAYYNTKTKKAAAEVVINYD